MKKITLLLSVLFFFGSCDEIPPDIPEIIIDGDRVVIIEEFSGGACTPCSDAAIILEEQLAIHEGNLVVVTIHTFSPANSQPSFGSAHDFRTENGQQILSSFGAPIGIPIGVINRKVFDGEDDFFLGKNKWVNNINAELAIAPKAILTLVIELEANTRTINIEATIVPADDILGEAKLTALITESHIIDKQATPNGVVDDWEHNHILRDFITALNGESLGDNLLKGVPIVKNLSFTIPEEVGGLWKMENLEVVAYISEVNADTREILQAATIGISE